MSPLVRIRQVAACTLVLFLPLSASAADPVPPSRTQQVAGPQPPTATQASPAAQPSPGTTSPSPVRLSPNAAAEIARSALLALEGTATANALRLRIRRTSDNSLINGDGVTVTVDGKSETVSHDADGYDVPLEDLRGSGDRNSGRELEVIVSHDGIREILSGKVALVDENPGESILRDHRQIAWWIVNIVVMLIAAMAISRRKG